MRAFKTEAWVTSAGSLEEVKTCFVLAKSLRAVATNRPIVLFTTSDVEHELRGALTKSFDYVHSLEDSKKNLTFHQLAQVSVLKLHWFEKCVYLDPNTLVLRNVDDIFCVVGERENCLQKNEETRRNCDQDSKLLLRSFAVRPDLIDYHSILEGIPDKGCLLKVTEDYDFNKHPALRCLPEKFCGVVTTEGFSVTSSDVSIVTFLADPHTFEGKNLGTLGNLAVKIWLKSYSEICATFNNMFTGSVSMLPELGDDFVNYSKEPIAIVGMSCRYPNSNNLDEFWKVLVEGKDCIRSPPSSRFRDNNEAKWNLPGGFLDIPLDQFDYPFFGISPKEVVQMDPQHRLLLQLMWEALEDSATDPSQLHSTNGSVFLGTWTTDFKEILEEIGYTKFYRKYMGNSIGAGAARLSFHLGLTGPCIATESGCSAAMVAVHLACEKLHLHKTSMALACGANLIIQPMDFLMMHAPDGKCKCLDSTANGFGRAEGLGVVVLKRLSDAVRDNDRIWALIRGSGIAQEGVSKSMGTPTVHSESLAMIEALKDADVRPEQVSYVEMHGTGTPTGDPIEIKAIAKAYYSENRKEPLVIGSAKTNVGHTESCSGMVNLMKVALQMKHGIIAPHRHLHELNPAIDLNLIPARVPLVPEKWAGKRLVAGVSSFGITGTDAHLIMEEPPKNLDKKFVTDLRRPWHMLKISAKTEEAFNLLLEKYSELLKREEAEALENICYTGNVGRADFPFRTCVIGKTKAELVATLEKHSLEKTSIQKIPEGSRLKKICFLFTGQGSNYPSMAKDLYETCPVFRIHFEHCAKLLETKHNMNLVEVLWSDEADIMKKLVYTQIGVFVVQYALCQLWKSWGITPDFVLGHSMGEFAASVCAGMFRLEDGLKMIVSRCEWVKEKCPPGEMLAIRAEKGIVLQKMMEFAAGKEDSSKSLDLAATNSREQTVVAGDPLEIQEFSEYLTAEGLKTTTLKSYVAHHSRHMDSIMDDLAKLMSTLKSVHSSNWTCGYVSSVTGQLIKDQSEVGVNYWLDNVRQPVNFLEASETVAHLGATIFVEIGPQPVLSVLQMMNTPSTHEITCLPSLKRNEESWRTMLESVKILYTSGVDVNWKGLDKLYDRKKVSLPTYPFIGKSIWPEDLRNLGNDNEILHPLLGSRIPNATKANIFQAGLNLADLEYVKEHVFGDRVIYPGACFLETMLAAGRASLENEGLGIPLMLENMVIDTPLCLEEGKTSVTQVVTGEDEQKQNGKISVKIFGKADQNGENKDECIWRKHAQAEIVTFPSDEDTMTGLDMEKFERTKYSDSDDKLVEGIYEKFEANGLKFGDTFRNLEKIWRGDGHDDNYMLAKVKLPTKHNNQNYVIHPVIIDAMFQALIVFNKEKAMKKRFYVPVKVGRFVCLAGGIKLEKEREGEDGSLYIHVPNSHSAVLYSSSGIAIGIMSQVELIDTSLSAINAALEQQTSKLPTLWEEVWKGLRGTMQYRLKLDSMENPEKFFSDEFLQLTQNSCNVLREDNLKTWKLVENFVFYNILKGLYDCGWKGGLLDEVVCLEEVVKSLGIVKKYENIVGAYFAIFEEEGYYESFHEKLKWKVVKQIPSSEKVDIHLRSGKELEQVFQSTRLLNSIGDNLGKILRGEEEAANILFPDGLHQFEEEFVRMTQGLELCTQVVEERLKIWKNQMSGEKFVVRILEIGSGIGDYTQIWMNALENLSIECEFHYANISQQVSKGGGAEKTMEKYSGKIKVEKVNLEEDLLNQGFLPEYFDYIVACDITTQVMMENDILQSLRNVGQLLRNGGSLDIFEQRKPNRIKSFIYGCLADLNHFSRSADQWTQALEETGYSLTQDFYCCHDNYGMMCAQKLHNPKMMKNVENCGNAWIVLKPSREHLLVDTLIEKLTHSCQRQVTIVERGSKYSKTEKEKFVVRGDLKEEFELVLKTVGSAIEGVVYAWPLDYRGSHCQSELLHPYLNLIQSLSSLNQGNLPRCVVLTSKTCPTADEILTGFPQATLWGFTKCMTNEMNISCCCIDIHDDANEILHEIWSTDKENQICFSADDQSRLVPRMQMIKASQSGQSLRLPRIGAGRFQIAHPESRKISDLTFIPLLVNFKGEMESSNQVEIEVHATALNFRDTLAVVKPNEYFQSINTVGQDLAGVVTRVGKEANRFRLGDRVFWYSTGRDDTFRSHFVTDEERLARIPKGISFTEAATLPCAFLTAYTSLVDVANLKSEDKILIHTASGGVGLCCIELCRHLGVPTKNIFCTAGSKRKRYFLKETCGISHVFNSRTTEYSEEIMKLTGGEGVDVVVNTLTTEGFKEATLQCLSQQGCFVELSKLNVWTKEEVLKMRPQVKYEIVDISIFSKDKCGKLMNILAQLLEEKRMNPLPYTRFDGQDLRQGLEFLQRSKQIGKVVCVMPRVKVEQGKMIVSTPMFDEYGTYLITGGLGGIGFEVAKWMIKQGAKNLLLIGRREPNAALQREIKKMNDDGALVLTTQVDISNYSELKFVLENMNTTMKLPPLKGVMHCAGALEDGTISSFESWEGFSIPLKAKVEGTCNLHRLTTELKIRLEHFVLFSSVTALLGTPGQSNYSAGNCFEDGLAHYRNSIGLPAATVNWGVWSEVGLAKEIEIPGMRGISTEQGLAALEYAMKSHRIQTCAMNVSSYKKLADVIPQTSLYLDESTLRIHGENTDSVSNNSNESTEFWEKYDGAVDVKEKLVMMQKMVEMIMRGVLKLDHGTILGPEESFAELGVDSLMFIELKNSLQVLLGKRIAFDVEVIREADSLSKLSSTLMDFLEGGKPL